MTPGQRRREVVNVLMDMRDDTNVHVLNEKKGCKCAKVDERGARTQSMLKEMRGDTFANGEENLYR